MNDDRLSKLLRDLPRPVPPPGFTGRVLRRLERGPAPRPALLPRFVAIGAAVALLAAGGVAVRLQYERAERARVIESLEARRQALARELEELRDANQPPVVVLPGPDVDVVYDPAPAVRTDVSLVSNVY